MHERNCERAELSLETCTCAQNGECRPFLEIQEVKITKSSSVTSMNPGNDIASLYTTAVHPLNCNG